FAASLVVGRDPLTGLIMGLRVLGLALLVLTLGAATLRAREVYADVRASVWDGPDGALGRLLDEMVDEQTPALRAPLRLHPPSAGRRRALDDTRGLFRLSFWDACLAGAAATVAFENVATVADWLTTAWNVPFLATSVAALVFAPLLTGIIGLGVWRMV